MTWKENALSKFVPQDGLNFSKVNRCLELWELKYTVSGGLHCGKLFYTNRADMAFLKQPSLI